jgi:adenine-specific DNA-methyltransferase
MDASDDTAPLIYPGHFADGFVKWPRPAYRKPNALVRTTDTASLFVPSAIYAVVKRFSSKEERRRVVAAVYDPSRVEAEVVGFENHLNYFHEAGKGLSMALAKGLAAFLNTTTVDTYFRQFNGHTQVNATDLRSLPFPSREDLCAVGRHVGTVMPSQAEVDELVDRLIFDAPAPARAASA